MPLNYLFWGIYIAALLVALWGYYAPNTPWYRGFSGAFVLWILVGILGYRVFGSAVK